MFKVGGIDFEHRTVLSPMASLTDLAFRKLLDEVGGVGYMVTEMVSVEGIVRRNRKTLKMLRSLEFKTPQFVQLFGADPGSFQEAVEFVQETSLYSGIDINMGCPVKKIVSRGAGAALLDNPSLAAELVRRVREKCRLPVTVKIRLCPKEEETLELIRILEREGADAVTVHFRRAADRYSDPADWSPAPGIARVSEGVLIGNGDIRSAPLARERLKWMDAVMIGREAMRNPGLFSEIARLEGEGVGGSLAGGEPGPLIRRLLELIEEQYPPDLRLNRIKSYTRFLVSGLREARHLRSQVYASRSFEEARDALHRYYRIDQEL
jgi:nifR3 family TIM-barrel protein